MSADKRKFSLVWDYDLTEDEFTQILQGKLNRGRLNQKWAAVRLLEYGSYEEIKRLLGLEAIAANWPKWRPQVRSESRRRGFDFLADWMKSRER
jgi:hypothetical protein